jgi:hypothetical protein
MDFRSCSGLTCTIIGNPGRVRSELTRGSARICRTFSCPLISQTGRPPGSTALVTGASARSWAYSGGGSNGALRVIGNSGRSIPVDIFVMSDAPWC